MRGTMVIYPDAERRLIFGAGLAKYGPGRQRFVVNLSNQEGFAAVVFFPDLADLDLSRGHPMTLVGFPKGVNTCPAA
jgi:hypothetical protein